MTAYDVDGMRSALRLGPEHADVLGRLAAVGSCDSLRLPDAELEPLLIRLGLSADDRSEVRATRPTPADPTLYWLWERCAHQLVRGLGGLGTLDAWPTLPDELGARGRLIYVWVFLAAVPHVRAYHAEHGIPEAATFDILRELGSQMDNYRAMYGRAGLTTQAWLTVHFRGALYRLGRLLYERIRLPFAIPEIGPAATEGAYALGIHIPRGRLTPESVDDSLARARDFFGRHFPAEPYEIATCTSWVLDDQLADYLAPDTNILRFQRRFRPIGRESDRPADATTIEAVFRRTWPGVDHADELPQRTTLERGIVARLRAGGHWHYRTGWLRLP